MARIRSVHPELCTSETMAVLPAEVERTFIRLWTHCDDEGRAVDNPKLLKAALFPLHDDVTTEDIDAELDELAVAGVIVRYAIGEKRYLAVVSWGEFQHPQRPSKSKIPAPNEGSLIAPRARNTNTSGSMEPSASTQTIESGTDGILREPSANPPRTLRAGVEREREKESTREPAAARPFDAEFEALWKHYPRKVDKLAAYKAYVARRRQGIEHERLVAAVEHYAEACDGAERQFVKHGSTFLAGAWAEWETGPPEAVGAVNGNGGVKHLGGLDPNAERFR